MGTRCLTFVYDGEEPVINMYRQFDGYPTGHGAELAEFLNGGRLVNGLINTKTPEEVVFNGMGCLAASMIAHFKQTPGSFYIHPVTDLNCGQDYEYHIHNNNGLVSGSQFRIEVYNCGCNFFGMSGDTHEKIFDGTLAEFTEFCKEKETA
jgi:hypothetical protein